MKTLILCILCFAAGAIGSWLAVGYWARTIHQRQMAMMFAGNVGLDAMRAEQMKLGATRFVLRSLENGLPDQVIFMKENEMFNDSLVADSALTAVKRFYVCTNTDIPERIASIMAKVELADDACSQPDAAN